MVFVIVLTASSNTTWPIQHKQPHYPAEMTATIRWVFPCRRFFFFLHLKCPKKKADSPHWMVCWRHLLISSFPSASSSRSVLSPFWRSDRCCSSPSPCWVTGSPCRCRCTPWGWRSPVKRTELSPAEAEFSSGWKWAKRGGGAFPPPVSSKLSRRRTEPKSRRRGGSSQLGRSAPGCWRARCPVEEQQRRQQRGGLCCLCCWHPWEHQWLRQCPPTFWLSFSPVLPSTPPKSLSWRLA